MANYQFNFLEIYGSRIKINLILNRLKTLKL